MTTKEDLLRDPAKAPPVLPVRLDQLPESLTALPQWVLWRWRWRAKEGRWTKPPMNARTGEAAKSNDPDTWTDFLIARQAYSRRRHGAHGVGFVLDDGYVGIDLDDCRDPDTGEIAPASLEIAHTLGSYCEVSPSGTGLKVLLRGELPDGTTNTPGEVEAYGSGRYFALTGHRLDGTPAEPVESPEALAEFCDKHLRRRPRQKPAVRRSPVRFDDLGVLDRAGRAKNGDKFQRLWDGNWQGLYPSQSEADFALCNILWFWTGDPARVDTLFRSSALYREKWDARGGYYGRRTLENACTGEVYRGRPESRPSSGAPGKGPPDEPVGEPDPEMERDATAADLVRLNATVRWAWEKWLPVGVLTILAAEPGCGKTRFGCDLARRIFLGLPWPDGSPPTFPPGTPTLWVAADNQHPELGSIPGAFGFDAEKLFLNAKAGNPFVGTMLDTAEDLWDFEARIERVKPGIVFIDTSLNATDKSAHKPEDAKAFFKPLAEIAARQATCIVCVTHLNAAGKPLGRRIEGQGRVVIMLENPNPEGEPNRRKLWVKKSNSLFPPALGVTMGNSGNEYDDKPPQPPVQPETDRTGTGKGKRGKAGVSLDDAVDWLEESLLDGPRKVADIIDQADNRGITTGTLYRAKDRLNVRESVGRPKVWTLEPAADDVPI